MSESTDANRDSLGRLVRVVHGHLRGKRQSPEYVAWRNMKRRCTDLSWPDYHNYGGRGISVCLEWINDFAIFLRDVGPRPSRHHSLERKDNDGNYEPGNVRWATKREQCRNMRKNVRLTMDGQTKCLTEWAEDYGVNPKTLSGRLFTLGMDLRSALTTPSMRGKKRG